MNRCPKCGTEFEGNFCPECGTKWQEEKTCPNCGAVLKGDVKFCNNCGYAFYREPAPAPAPESAPAPVRSQTAKTPQGDVLKKVLRYLPAGLFLLFSLLLWAFYAAPVFKANLLIGTIEGNLYQIYGEEVFGDLHGAILALYIFTAFSCVAAAVCLYLSYKNPKDILSAVPLLFYLLFLVLGSVLTAKVGQADLTAGACPILILVFSCLFALLTGAGWYFGRRGSHEKAPREHAEKERAEVHTAENKEPVPPVAVEKPVKPSLLRKDTLTPEARESLEEKLKENIWDKRSHVIGFWLFAWLGGMVVTLLDLDAYSVEKKIFYAVLAIAIVGFVGLLVTAVILSNKDRLKGWHPEKVYRRWGSIVTAVIGILLLVGFIAVIVWRVYEIFGPNFQVEGRRQLVYLIYSPLFFFIIIYLCSKILKTASEGKNLSIKLCGYSHPKLNSELVAQYEEERRAYETQHALYQKYRREVTEYRYAAARYKAGKPNDEKPYPVKWAFTHKLAVGAAAVGLAAVIVATSCFFGLRGVSFSLGTVKKIGLGDETAQVTKVLGEPFKQDEYVWNFYERKVLSLRKEMEELSEKAKDASSASDLEKFMKKYAELEKELSEMTYKEIDIFFSDGAVTSVMLNTQAGNSGTGRKETKSVTLVPESVSTSDKDVKVAYQVEYEDGSYQTAYLPAGVLSQANLGKVGSYHLEWSDGWGDYEAVLNVS